MILGDSHTHLDEYPPEEIPGILERARDAQVGLIVCAGTTIASSRACIGLAEKHDVFLAGVGIHPMQVEGPVDEEVYSTLHDLAASSPKVVCVSEVGLDFLPESPDRELQYQAFREQIRLARQLNLPVIFHSRESHAEVLRTLREERAYEVGGVMHYFQADEATAREAIESGFYVSLARPLLRLPELQEVVRKLPLENIVLETDAAPQPFKKYRHNWTEPWHVKGVAEKLAELKGVTPEEVAQVTTSNLTRLLKLDPAACHSERSEAE
jgi:TatD DNase family protein